MTTAATIAAPQRAPELFGHTAAGIVDTPLSSSARRMQPTATGSGEDTP